MKIYKDENKEINIDITKGDLVIFIGIVLGIILLILANI
jgi:hypothetical protein